MLHINSDDKTHEVRCMFDKVLISASTRSTDHTTDLTGLHLKQARPHEDLACLLVANLKIFLAQC